MCDLWRKDFVAFMQWAEANGWKRGLQIDREDNDGHYEPGNCRFVTPLENCKNRRPRSLRRSDIDTPTIVAMRANGMSVAEIAKELGAAISTIRSRMKDFLLEGDA
jgi:hypothetical protein